MNSKLLRLLAGGVGALVCSSLIHAQVLSEEAMMIKASELTKLTTALESAVRYEQAQSATLGDAELLDFATSNDPDLLGRFAGLKVRVSRSSDPHAAVLVCSEDGTQALFEDVGCTAAMDRHAWKETPAAQCEFVLDISSLCTMSRAMVAQKALALKSSAAPFNTPLIEVADAVWTREVNKETKKPVTALSRSVSGDRLVLWMQIKGSERALDQLVEQGKLPIRHKWFRDSIVGSEARGVETPIDEIEIPAAKRGIVSKLRNEVRSTGHFSWRTWSYKEKPGRGTWKVRVVYADNTPVFCGAPVSGNQPCEYKIEVR